MYSHQSQGDEYSFIAASSWEQKPQDMNTHGYCYTLDLDEVIEKKQTNSLQSVKASPLYLTSLRYCQLLLLAGSP